MRKIISRKEEKRNLRDKPHVSFFGGDIKETIEYLQYVQYMQNSTTGPFNICTYAKMFIKKDEPV